MVVKNEEEFGRAIRQREERIYVRGRFTPKLERLYTMNEILWGVCVGCLTVAMATLIKIRPKQDGNILHEPPRNLANKGLREQLISEVPGAKRVGKSLLSSSMAMAEACGSMDRFKSFRRDYEMELGVPDGLIFRRKKSRG